MSAKAVPEHADTDGYESGDLDTTADFLEVSDPLPWWDEPEYRQTSDEC